MSADTNPKRTFIRTDRGKLIAVIASTGLLIGASFGVQAVAESKVFQHAKLMMSNTTQTTETQSNPFVQHASWKQGGFFGSRDHRRRGWANLSDEEVEKRINRAVRHAAIEIDATPEQTQKITALLTAVAKDVRPLRQEFRTAGKEMQALLTADNVDREALEKLRAERMARADTVSRELVKAVADVAEVLTPEQRKIVQERAEQFRSFRGHRRGHGRWHRG